MIRRAILYVSMVPLGLLIAFLILAVWYAPKEKTKTEEAKQEMPQWDGAPLIISATTGNLLEGAGTITSVGYYVNGEAISGSGTSESTAPFFR